MEKHNKKVRIFFRNLFYSSALVLSIATGQYSIAGIERSGDEVKVDPYPTPRLHIVSIGTNKYEHSFELKYAAGDAERVSQAFLLLEPRAEIVENHLLIDSTTTEINHKLSQVAGAIGESDTVIIYWAGHSTFSKDDNILYLFAKDSLASSEHDVEQGIPFFSLLEYFDKTDRVVFLGDGCNFGDGFGAQLSLHFPNTSIISSSKADEIITDGLPSIGGSFFAYHLEKALGSPIPDLDGDTFISAEELYIHIYPKIVNSSKVTNWVQHPTLIGRNTHHATLVKAHNIHASFEFEKESDFITASLELPEVNGNPINQSVFDEYTKTLRLGEEDKNFFRNGLNVIRNVKGRYLFWLEDGKLAKYESPYKKSHAVIVAIDDYDRRNDPEKRQRTGLTQLSGMVSRAKELGDTFEQYGFDKITYIFDEDATSNNVEKVLRDYWIGEKYEDIDRLVFYFGGHGLDFTDQTLLATYDYEASRKLGTTFRAMSLIREHSESIASRHVLFLLDVCHAGLAVAGTLSDQDMADAEMSSDVATFRRLSAIRDDSEDKSRNILVAGTGNQEALWLNGGVFTKSLVESLRNENNADLNNDGVLQFHEYANKIRGEVSEAAAIRGHRQKPSFKILTSHGNGRMLFDLIDFRANKVSSTKNGSSAVTGDEYVDDSTFGNR